MLERDHNLLCTNAEYEFVVDALRQLKKRFGLKGIIAIGTDEDCLWTQFHNDFDCNLISEYVLSQFTEKPMIERAVLAVLKEGKRKNKTVH
jgi:hypothetical protein